MTNSTLTYLILPVMCLEVGLLVYVLTQDARSAASRLLAAYLVVALVGDALSVIRGTTLSIALATFAVVPLAVLLALSAWLLAWLTLALCLPERFAQPAVRWLIAAPYLVVLVTLILDAVFSWGLWFKGLARAPDGTYLLQLSSNFSPLLGALIAAQFVPICMAATVALRHPERRVPALTIFAGTLIAALILSAPFTRGVPIFYNLAPLPVYLALAFATVRYQLFRPTPVALQVALESLPDGLLFLDRQRIVRYANAAARRLLPATAQPVGLAAALDAAGLALTAGAAQGGEQRYARTADAPLLLDSAELLVPGDPRGTALVVLRDVTVSETQAAALRTQNAEQQRLLALVSTLETSTVTLADDVLLAPIVGHLDTRRAAELTSRLLADAYDRRTKLVILDITGVPVVDTAVAQALIRTAEALGLLGCAVTLGASPATALVLATQEVTLGGLRSVRSPQEALALWRGDAASVARR